MAYVSKFLPEFSRRPAPGKSRERRKSTQTDERAIAEDIARIGNEEARRAHQIRYLDSAEPESVSPPSKRTVQPGWKKRKPIVKGGAVIGRRSRYADA